MALFGLHVPTFGPLHPIIGNLPSSSLSGFTQYYVPFGNATGGLTESGNLAFTGSILTLEGALVQASGAVIFNNGNGDFDFRIKADDGGDAYKYDAGALQHTFTDPVDVQTITADVVATNNYRDASQTKSIIYNSGSSRWYVSYNLGVSGNLEASGTCTLPAMSTAGFVKNSVTGLLIGGNTISVGDITDISTTYLKIDCSNDPITDALHFTNTTEYIDQEEW